MPIATRSMPHPGIAARRLAGQGLVRPPDASPVEVVARMGALQAQDYGAAKWAVAQRTHEATDTDVERALVDGEILRTHVLRPTWHFVATTDIRWMLELTAPRVRAQMAHYDRKLELDDAVYRKSNATIAKALRNGPRTRAELDDALTRARIDTSGLQRLGHLMMRAELDAVICSGPRQGKQFTYALLDACTPKTPNTSSLPRHEALAELAKRYFTTRGPATVQDFAWWSGLTVADAIRGAELAGDVVRSETIDGRRYWTAASSPDAKRASSTAHLLPTFDEYYIAYKNRDDILVAARAAGKKPWAPGLTDNLVVLGAQIAGSWKRTSNARGASITLRTIRELSAPERARIAKQAKRYAAFLGVPLQRLTESTI